MGYERGENRVGKRVKETSRKREGGWERELARVTCKMKERKKRWKEGRKDGINKGMKDEKKIGKREGRKEGKMEGRKEGRMEGKKVKMM